MGKPIELMYPNHPKEVRKREVATKRVAHAELVTPESIAKQLEAWAIDTEAIDLKEFTVPRKMRVKKLKEMAQENTILKEAYELAREAIAYNINRTWAEKPYLKDYANMYVEYYDDDLHAHKNNIRAAVTAKTTQGSTTINLMDTSGYRQTP